MSYIIPSRRGKFWEGAKTLAQFLSLLPGTKAVGLFGSLAREERAVNDIDIAVFNDTWYQATQMAYPFHLELGLGSIPWVEGQAGLVLKLIVEQYQGIGITFDLQVFPTKLDPAASQTLHPVFLYKVGQDIRFWNPATKSFCKSQKRWDEFQGQTVSSRKVQIQLVSGQHQAGEGSALVVRDGNLTIGFDCGASPTNGKPHYDQIARVTKALAQTYSLTHLVVSHFHYDHIGALLSVLQRLRELGKPWPVIVATDLTFALLKEHLAANGLREDWVKDSPRPTYKLIHQTGTNQIQLLANRHSVPGSASILFQGTRTLLYSGDLWQLEADRLPPVDLLIMDSTSGTKREPREADLEAKIRSNLERLIRQGLELPRSNMTYVAMFSTQLERARWLFDLTRGLTKSPPLVSGISLLRNLGLYMKHQSGIFYEEKLKYRLVLMTGAWAQGENDEAKSALIKLSEAIHPDCQLTPGDLVIISASIPTWSSELTKDIETMCRRLNGLGAKVVVDTTAPENWQEFASRQAIHASGHGNLPEIVKIIQAVKPKKVLPFHASPEARAAVASFCRSNGFAVVTGENSVIAI